MGNAANKEGKMVYRGSCCIKSAHMYIPLYFLRSRMINQIVCHKHRRISIVLADFLHDGQQQHLLQSAAGERGCAALWDFGRDGSPNVLLTCVWIINGAGSEIALWCSGTRTGPETVCYTSRSSNQ